jgi:hypothetical protein
MPTYAIPIHGQGTRMAVKALAGLRGGCKETLVTPRLEVTSRGLRSLTGAFRNENVSGDS